MRLADEIDVTASRNSKAIYDLSKIVEEIDLIEFMKHEAVKSLDIKEKEFVMRVASHDEKILNGLSVLASKMQKTLDYCRKAVNDLTPFAISQELVRIEKI